MIDLRDYITDFPIPAGRIENMHPWQLANRIEELLAAFFETLPGHYIIRDNLAYHESAVIEAGALIRGRAIIGPGCYIASSALLRSGVLLGKGVTIGPGSEIKSSVIADNSSLAHFNYIGNSLVGSDVNFEAGSVIANHHNDRIDKRIFVRIPDNGIFDTGETKFGALVGDRCKIGANAVLSPGTLLLPDTIVKRLTLIEPV